MAGMVDAGATLKSLVSSGDVVVKVRTIKVRRAVAFGVASEPGMWVVRRMGDSVAFCDWADGVIYEVPRAALLNAVNEAWRTGRGSAAGKH